MKFWSLTYMIVAVFKYEVKIKNVGHVEYTQNLKMMKIPVDEKKCKNDESMIFDDDNEKSDDENKFDTKSRSQMRSSSHLYYQVLESSYLLEGTTALLLRSRVGYVHPQLVMMTLMKSMRLPAVTSSTFQL